MGSPLTNAGVFLIGTLFQLYILAVLLRFLFQATRADFYNPFSQALVVITNPTLVPLRRLIPGLYGIDLAAIVLMLVLACLKTYLLALIRGFWPAPIGLLVYSAAELLELTIYVFIITIFIRVLLSWIVPYGRSNPAAGLLISVSEPLLRPARRLIPPISGLDLSPIVVFIVLYLALILMVHPLQSVGARLFA